MDFYHIYCDLKPGASDMDFADSVQTCFAHLKQEGLIEGSRITRRKLGLGPADGTEFHIWLEMEHVGNYQKEFKSAARVLMAIANKSSRKVDQVFFGLFPERS